MSGLYLNGLVVRAKPLHTSTAHVSQQNVTHRICKLRNALNAPNTGISRSAAKGNKNAGNVEKTTEQRNAPMTKESVYNVKVNMRHGTMHAQCGWLKIPDWKR
jgi:hypothetical protein